ncbi:hypothetical protein [Streptosporangium sp. LJ11]
MRRIGDPVELTDAPASGMDESTLSFNPHPSGIQEQDCSWLLDFMRCQV